MVSVHTRRQTGFKSFVLSILITAIPASRMDAQVENAAFRPDTPPAGTARKLSPEEMGDLYMARKMFREAVETYREGSPNSPILWDKIGIAYHQIGDLNAARKSYEHAVKLDPKYADAINNVGTIFYSQKRYRSAISRYNKALRLSPNAASVWSNLGTAYYARHEYALMSKAYARALEIDPLVFEAHGAVGTMMLDRAVADRARYHFEMARVYAQAGQSGLALQYLRKSLEEGFADKEKVNKTPEFAALRDTKEYKELMDLEPRVL